MVKALAEAAKEKMELNRKCYEETEWEKMTLDRVQATYQTQLMSYEVQAPPSLKSWRKRQSSKWAESRQW